jgi:hypothetical protein
MVNLGAIMDVRAPHSITDINGSYLLTNVAPGIQAVTASADGFVDNTSNIPVTVGLTTIFDFVLTQAGSITGKVTNASSGAGIHLATVSAGGATTTTDPAGNYTLANVAPGTYTVDVTAAGYVAQSLTNVPVTQGTTTTRDFALVTTPVGVRGDVNPIPGLDVGDVLFCAQFVAGVRTPTTEQLALADVNTITGMDVGDVLFVAQAVAGLRQLV